ncbi:MAG: extracellular solute-binding protein [Actinomycetaceae bacterium]|nr:extracellular solute-binding protein [Actinomycetaceae bacterium]
MSNIKVPCASAGTGLFRKRAVAGIAGFALVLSGCSIADQASSVKKDGADDAGQTVTVITHDSFELSDELRAQFTAETGYTLQTTAPGDSGMVVNQLVLNKDNPTVDAVYGIESFTAQRAIDEGVLVDYVPVNDPGADYRLDGLTAIDIADVCVNYDVQWFVDADMDLPQTLADLTKPEYAELLVVQNPAHSSTGLAFLVATAIGTSADTEGAGGEPTGTEPAGVSTTTGMTLEEYWSAIISGGAKISDSWSDSYYVDFSGADGKGEYPLVVSYASSPAESEGATGVIEGTCVRQIEYAGVVAGAQNPQGAQAFIDFMVSDAVQESLPESMYVYPVADVPIPENWAQYAVLVDEPILPDPVEVGQYRDSWLTMWTAIFEQHR